MAKLILIFLLIVSCTKNDKCNKQCLRVKLRNHKMKQVSFWKDNLQKTFHQRVMIANKDVVDLIAIDNKVNNIPNSPSIPTVKKEFIQDIQEALNELPKVVKDLFSNNFAGVYLIDDLGGSGFSDAIKDKTGKRVGAFIILDYKVLLKRSANDWATWKESTPFKSSPLYEINAIIEKDERNNRKYAIQYILLHELGHVLAINNKFHPYWGTPIHLIGSTESYPFYNLSWKLDRKNKFEHSIYDFTYLTNREDIVYYWGAKLKIEQAKKLYSQLEKTNFSTLYAATSPADDWAESFVTYIHTILMELPFEIQIKKEGQIIKSYKTCWGTPRCKKKETILSQLFESNS